MPEAFFKGRPLWPIRYAVAVASVAVAVSIKLLTDPLIVQETPFLLIFGAIMVSAWFGGFGPGLLATVISAAAADYFFLSPKGSFSSSTPEAAPLLGFLLEGILVSSLAAGLQRARERAESSTLEAQRHEENLRESEERFRLMVEGVADYAIFMLDADGHIATWNSGAERIIGYRAEEIIGRHFSVFYTEEDTERNHPENELREATTRGRYEEEGLRVRKDGSTFWSSVVITAVRDEQGNLRGFSKVTRDITEARRVAESLRQSEERYRAVVEQTAEAIFLVDIDTKRIVEANGAFRALLGYALDERPQLTLYDVVTHERESVDEYLRRILEHGRYFVGERRYRRRDGSLLDVEVNASVISYGGKNVICVAARDITERKEAEATLRRSLNSLLALYEASQVLGSTLEQEQIGRKLLEIAQRISDLSAGCIDLLDDDHQLRTLREVGSEDFWRRARSDPGARAARRAALNSGEYRTFELPSEEGGPLLAGICLPLRARDRVVGLLETYGTRSVADRDDLEILLSLANQGASALDNARLYEELAARKQELQELIGRIVEAQEEERRRIAYEVHDGLTQIAVAAHQRLQIFGDEYPSVPAQAQRDLHEIGDLVRRTVSEARHVIADLRPTALDDYGLAEAVRMQVDQLRAAGYQAVYEVALDATRLPAVLETTLFRVAQEALTNVQKHAGTERVRVALERRNGTVRLEVRDWGRGFEPSRGARGGGPGERVGLASMRERVTLLGGTLEIRSKSQEGTSVVAEVPLPETGEGTEHEG